MRLCWSLWTVCGQSRRRVIFSAGFEEKWIKNPQGWQIRTLKRVGMRGDGSLGHRGVVNRVGGTQGLASRLSDNSIDFYHQFWRLRLGIKAEPANAHSILRSRVKFCAGSIGEPWDIHKVRDDTESCGKSDASTGCLSRPHFQSHACCSTYRKSYC